MKTQKERLELIENNILNILPEKRNQQQKLCLEMLRLIRENPELNDKIKSFYESDVYCTSRKDIIIYKEIGRIK